MFLRVGMVLLVLDLAGCGEKVPVKDLLGDYRTEAEAVFATLEDAAFSRLVAIKKSVENIDDEKIRDKANEALADLDIRSRVVASKARPKLDEYYKKIRDSLGSNKANLTSLESMHLVVIEGLEKLVDSIDYSSDGEPAMEAMKTTIRLLEVKTL